MDFEYSLLTNRDGPLARKEIRDLSELDKYMEILHDDFQLPGEEGGDGVRWHVNPERRIHVYERCSQSSIRSSRRSDQRPTWWAIAPCPQHWSSTIWC